MTKAIPLIPAAILSLFLGASARADEITSQLDAARAEYDSGELRKAVQTLQFAVAGIQEKINLDLLKLLPEPLEGWRADEPQIQSAGMAAMIAGTSLSRRYFRDDGAEVEVSMMANSPLMPMMTMMLSNPLMIQMSPSTKMYTHAGQHGVIEHDEAGDRWEISLLVSNKILVKVEGSGLKGKADAEAYLKVMDLNAMQKAFGV